MKRVLITGMSGLIGGILRSHLEDIGGYTLAALNRSPVRGMESYQADISSLDEIKPAFHGQDVVVHLAASVTEQPLETLLETNLMGTYNVFEASRLAGVKRIVFASSGATVNGWQSEHPYDDISQGNYDDVPDTWPIITHHQVRPQGIYGATKVWGEALARHYSDEFDLSIICVRIGHCHKEDRPIDARSYAVHLSHRDCADILHRCIEAPDSLKYDVFFATSNNKWGWRDLEHPRDVIGFVPRDYAEAYR